MVRESWLSIVEGRFRVLHSAARHGCSGDAVDGEVKVLRDQGKPEEAERLVRLNEAADRYGISAGKPEQN
jgi:hypothetical protein